MRETLVAKIAINNVPNEKEGFMVARKEGRKTTKLWYYGLYDSETRAIEVAKEVDGIVIEVIK